MMRNKYFILVLTFLCIIVSQESFGQDYNDNSWDAGGDVVGDPLDEVVVENDYHDSSDDVDPNADLYDPYNYGNEPTPIEDDDPHNDDPVVNPTNPATPDPEVCTLAVCTKTGYVVNTSLCACVPVLQYWYLDNDGDDYDGGSLYQAEKPSGNYKATTKGGDCDDNDARKNGSNCGLPLWYFDNDGDGYHGDIQDSATSPGKNWILTTKGEDCDDDEAAKTTDCVTLVWYLDTDLDGYDAGKKQVTASPGIGWINGTSKGEDCDDTDINKTTDCQGCGTKEKTKAKEVTTFANNAAVKTQILALQTSAKTDGFEKSTVINKNATTSVLTSPGLGTAGTATSTSMTASATTEAMLHAHPDNTGSSTYPTHSAGDIYGLNKAYTAFNNIDYSMTVGITHAYMLVVEDPAQLATFIASNSQANALVAGTGDLKPNTALYNDFWNAYNSLVTQGENADNAYASAMAYFLQSQNIGMVVYESSIATDGTTDFHRKNTTKTVTPAQPAIGTTPAVPEKTTYTKKDCL